MDLIIVYLYGIIVFITLMIMGGSFPSFYLLVRYRIRKGDIKGIFTGRSYCEQCNKQLKWYNLIPIFAYLIQKGECKNCGFKIPKKYFYYEFISGLLFGIIGLGIMITLCK